MNVIVEINMHVVSNRLRVSTVRAIKHDIDYNIKKCCMFCWTSNSERPANMEPTSVQNLGVAYYLQILYSNHKVRKTSWLSDLIQLHTIHSSWTCRIKVSYCETIPCKPSKWYFLNIWNWVECYLLLNVSFVPVRPLVVGIKTRLLP